MKNCKCGKNNYEWQMDDFMRSWLKCSDCGSNFFDNDIGVILINWRFTDISHIIIEDALCGNLRDNGVLHYTEGRQDGPEEDTTDKRVAQGTG